MSHLASGSLASGIVNLSTFKALILIETDACSMKNLLESYKKRLRNPEEEVGRDFGRKLQRNDTKPSSSACTRRTEIFTSEPNYEGPPHFLIIGAQKAGTMAAVKNLNKHPEIACISEEHYFDLGWHNKTVKHYRSLFTKLCVKEKRIIGEKTPEYGYVEECHSRINSVCSPDTKFIFMIRDPAKRAFSAWSMNVGRNFETNLFDECVDMNLKNLNEYRSHGTAEHHYVQRGFYLDQILKFLETFPNRYSVADVYVNT